jgi:adenosylcobinamide-phosphate synthase
VGVLTTLQPVASALAFAVLLDLLLGDPQYRLHPVRLIGDSIAGLEKALRSVGLDGRFGGVLLGAGVSLPWVGGTVLLLHVLESVHPAAAWVLGAVFAYTLLALRNLLDHAWAVEKAVRSGDLPAARRATSMFVARDTALLDAAACRRASIESLGESLTDGYVSALFWYAVGGLPGLVAFKVFSTLDSMVGYRSERYLRLGWFSARTDDVLNWIPARLSWLLISACAAVVPGCSPAAALVTGWAQHAIVPGPNAGWSEAATAGAIRRRLVGPIVLRGRLVTDLWLGDPGDAPAGHDDGDVPRAMALCTMAGLAAGAIAIATALWRSA